MQSPPGVAAGVHQDQQAAEAASARRTVARVAALGLGLSRQPRASAGVDDLRLADHQAVLDQLPNVLPCRRGGVGLSKRRPTHRLRVRSNTASTDAQGAAAGRRGAGPERSLLFPAARSSCCCSLALHRLSWWIYRSGACCQAAGRCAGVARAAHKPPPRGPTAQRGGLEAPPPLRTHGESSQNSLELAMEMSLTSLGSSQTLRRPHFSTLAARRFCSLSETMVARGPSQTMPAWWGPAKRGPLGGAAAGLARRPPREASGHGAVPPRGGWLPGCPPQ